MDAQNGGKISEGGRREQKKMEKKCAEENYGRWMGASEDEGEKGSRPCFFPGDTMACSCSLAELA